MHLLINHYSIAYSQFWVFLFALMILFADHVDRNSTGIRATVRFGFAFLFWIACKLLQLVIFSPHPQAQLLLEFVNKSSSVFMLGCLTCFIYTLPVLIESRVQRYSYLNKAMLLFVLSCILLLVIDFRDGGGNWLVSEVASLIMLAFILSMMVWRFRKTSFTALKAVKGTMSRTSRKRYDRGVVISILPICLLFFYEVTVNRLKVLPPFFILAAYDMRLWWIIALTWINAGFTILVIPYSQRKLPFMSKVFAIYLATLMVVFNALALLIGIQLETTYIKTFPAPAGLTFDAAITNGAYALSYRQYLHDHLWPLALIAALTPPVISLVKRFVFKSAMLRSLDNLLGGVHAVHVGNLEIAIPNISNDEVGILTTAFNEMVDSIRKDQSDLQSINTNLEQLVTERTREMVDAMESAELANASKSQFLANISYDFRMPLNAITGYAQLLEHNYPDEEAPGIIYTNSRQLLNLINDGLDTARGEIKQLKWRPSQHNLDLILQQVVDTMAIQAQTKNLTFHVDVGKLPLYVIVDAQRMRQILLNLLGNAIKFTPSGSVTLEVNQLHLSADKAVLRFSVSDTGIGIPANQIKQIFEPFQQLGTNTEQVEGVGLGLAISKHLITLMGGQLMVESMPKLGSRFWFDATLVVVESSMSMPGRSVTLLDKPEDEIAMMRPQSPVLQRLRDAAQIGDIAALEHTVAELKQQGALYEQFVQRIDHYLTTFQMQALRRWLSDSHSAEKNDARFS